MPGFHDGHIRIRAARLCLEPGESRMLALQGLHPGQLVGNDHLFALLGQTGRLLIQGTDCFHCFVPMFIDRRGQPVADQMRLEIPFFNSRAACRGEICLMMPRAITSSAISRPVQWLIGRSFGCSQAIAIIWQVCSAVICEGRPGRGTSERRSLTDTSSSATACQPIQRMRQQRTVSTLIPKSRAIWLLFFPASAIKMIRPRSASCWGVLCRRTSNSNSFRSASFKVSASGLGPRIGWVLFLSVLRSQYTTELFQPQCTSSLVAGVV